MLESKSGIENSLKLWAEGKTTLREIKNYSDEELSAISRIGYFLVMQGKNEEARILFEGLVAVDPRNDYYFRALGVIFQKLGENERAIRQFSYAIKVKPDSPFAYVNRAEIYLSLREFNRAEDDLRDAISRISPAERQLLKKATALLDLICRTDF